MIQLERVSEYIEWNSTYVNGELKNQFLEFVEFYSSLGIEVDGFKLSTDRNIELEDGEVEDISFPNDLDEPIKIPRIWVLTSESDERGKPLFKPIVSDGYNSDFQKAVIEYGMDIIQLKYPLLDRMISIKVRVEDREFIITGDFTKLQTRVIELFDFPEIRLKIIQEVLDIMLNATKISSFLVTVPEHKNHVVLRIT